jgi:hypothetical protein
MPTRLQSSGSAPASRRIAAVHALRGRARFWCRSIRDHHGGAARDAAAHARASHRLRASAAAGLRHGGRSAAEPSPHAVHDAGHRSLSRSRQIMVRPASVRDHQRGGGGAHDGSGAPIARAQDQSRRNHQHCAQTAPPFIVQPLQCEGVAVAAKRANVRSSIAFAVIFVGNNLMVIRSRNYRFVRRKVVAASETRASRTTPMPYKSAALVRPTRGARNPASTAGRLKAKYPST